MPTGHDYWSRRDNYRSRHANIDANVNGMRSAGKNNADANNCCCNKGKFHGVTPENRYKNVPGKRPRKKNAWLIICPVHPKREE